MTSPTQPRHAEPNPQPAYPQPAYQQPMYQQPVPPMAPPMGNPYPNQPQSPKGTSAMAVTALVLGIIGLVLSWIPIVNNAAAVVAVIGLVFGIISVFTTGRKGKKKGRGLAIAGTVLCVVAIIITLVMQTSAKKTLDSISSGVGSSQQSTPKSESSAPVDLSTAKVEMQATATGKGTVLWGEAGSSNTQDFNGTWSKTITGDDAKKGYTLSVTGDIMGGNDQKVSCTVLVNGQQKSHKEGSGQSGAAMCDTYGIFN